MKARHSLRRAHQCDGYSLSTIVSLSWRLAVISSLDTPGRDFVSQEPDLRLEQIGLPFVDIKSSCTKGRQNIHSKYIYDTIESNHSECKHCGTRIRWIIYCLIRQGKAQILFLRLTNLKYIL
jgi:hypothetical protein